MVSEKACQTSSKFYWGPKFRNKFIYFSTNLSILLNRFDSPPPPTTRPHSVCVGSGLSVESVLLEAGDAHHGGDSCVFREFLGSRQNLIAVNLLMEHEIFGGVHESTNE